MAQTENNAARKEKIISMDEQHELFHKLKRERFTGFEKVYYHGVIEPTIAAQAFTRAIKEAAKGQLDLSGNYKSIAGKEIYVNETLFNQAMDKAIDLSPTQALKQKMQALKTEILAQCKDHRSKLEKRLILPLQP